MSTSFAAISKQLAARPRVYKNMIHTSYEVTDTTFDESLVDEDVPHGSPNPEEAAERAEAEAAKRNAKKLKGDKNQTNEEAEADEKQREADEKKSNAGKKKLRTPTGDNEEADDATKKGTDKTSSSATAAAEEEESTVPAEPASDSVFSQLLLESILEQKSVSDFITGLPDKRGTLLIRFPTTVLGKKWKKRYFTLHQDGLYFHEDQHVIHPQLASTINYKECKRIDIADYWIIQQDEASNSQAIAAAAARSGAAITGGPVTVGEKVVYGGGQPIPVDGDSADKDKYKPSSSSSSISSKFDEMFKKNQKDSNSASSIFSKKDDNVGSDVTVKKDEKEKDGPIVRGRRRSSLVNEKGSTVILLMAKDKKQDPIELTGLNEGSLADLAILNEWVLAINARICLLNFLHSPMTLTAMARGGREILAFLTDASARVLKIENKFTDLATVLTHFKDSLSQHRRAVSTASPNAGIKIIFRNCAMTDAALQALCAILTANTDIVVDLLDLSANVLTKGGMLALHEALRCNYHIKEVRLDGNQIGDDGLDILVNGEAASCLSKSKKKDSKEDSSASSSPAKKPEKDAASDESIDSETSIWSHDLALRSFSVRGNQISDTGLEKFLTSISDHLARVDADDNESSDDEDEKAADVTPSIGASPHAISFDLLDFNDNLITDLGTLVLGGFLTRNPTVKHLNLGANYITDNGVANLKEFLASEARQRGTLQKLDLAGNQITSLGVGFLVDALATVNVNGTTPARFDLDLSGNEGIGPDGVAKLLTLKVPTTATGTKSTVPAVQFHSLSFSVFDRDVLDARSADLSQCVPASSPRASLTVAAKQRNAAATGIAAITTSQQNVLNLFSPSVMNANAPTHMNYPTTTAQPAPAINATTLTGIAPTQNALMDVLGLSASPPAIQSSSTPVATNSAKVTPATATAATPTSAPTATAPVAPKKKSDKKALENSIVAPKIAINEKPIVSKVSIAPLHPAPVYTEPQPSPEAHATPVSLSLPSPAPTAVVAHSHPTPTNAEASPRVDSGLLPTQSAGEKKQPIDAAAASKALQ